MQLARKWQQAQPAYLIRLIACHVFHAYGKRNNNNNNSNNVVFGDLKNKINKSCWKPSCNLLPYFSFDSKIYVKWKFMRQLIYAVFPVLHAWQTRAGATPTPAIFNPSTQSPTLPFLSLSLSISFVCRVASMWDDRRRRCCRLFLECRPN